MRTRTVLALGFVTLALAAGAMHCGGSTSSTGSPVPGGGGDGGGTPPPGSGPPPIDLGPPTNHRATADACSMSRGAGLQGDAGAEGGFPGSCANDSQCTMGTNGRCEPSGHNAGPLCSYDECFADSDCGSGKVCECGQAIGTGTTQRTGNTCLPGNCRLDADCGAGSFCSPTYDTSCGPYNGTVGYYCHTPSDECTNDDQCSDGGFGYCAFDPMKSHWVCEHSICAG